MATKSIQRSTAELKARGYRYAIVERFNQFAHVRQDVFGFIDILAIKAEQNGVLAIQACGIGTGSGGGDLSSHVKKLTVFNPEDKDSARRIEAVKIWLRSNNRLEIWGWGKRGERGKMKRWVLQVKPVELGDLLVVSEIMLEVPIHTNGV